MNFLAHLHVHTADPEIQLGNALADLIKGREVALLPPGVQRGVWLHRRVDAYTDSHEMVLRGVARLSPRWGWFSGIILDIYYDHLLARDWARYDAMPLGAFADGSYALMQAGAHHLTDGEAREFLHHFVGSDRLRQYATVAGITDTLARTATRIARRLPARALPLAEAVPELRAADAEVSAEFHTFYPQLRAHVAESLTLPVRAFPQY